MFKLKQISVTPAKLATLCVYVVNYKGQSTTTVHGFLTCGHILNNCYFILTGQPVSENLIFYTMALRMVLKTTYKAPCITGTSTFKPFHICMLRNTHNLSENHSSMIQISSKVFSISVCEKQRSLVLIFYNYYRSRLVMVEVVVSRTNSYRGVRLSRA